MARKSVSCAVVPAGSLDGIRSPGSMDDPVNSVSPAAVAAAIAVLVADGASPTQGHVDTLNSAWTTFSAGLGAIPARADVLITYDTTAVVSHSVLSRAILRLMECAAGEPALTP